MADSGRPADEPKGPVWYPFGTLKRIVRGQRCTTAFFPRIMRSGRFLHEKFGEVGARARRAVHRNSALHDAAHRRLREPR